MEKIMADGVVTEDEKRELLSVLQRVEAKCRAGSARQAEVDREATPARKTTKLELTCMGNAGGGYINAQIQVVWFEVLVDHAQKRVDVIEHHLPIKNHRREKRINICEFQVPEGEVCFYARHVQTKPNAYESRFFRMDNGEFQVLGEGAQADFCSHFLGEYKDYAICSGGSREQVEENRAQRAELDKLGPGVYVRARCGTDPATEGDKSTVTVSIRLTRAQPLTATELRSSHFSVVELTQGTREWHDWRCNGMGASDAPTVMGENPWKTATDILSEKLGGSREGRLTAAMARGTDSEPEARQAYILQTGKRVEPACLQSNQHAWLRASVDGIGGKLDAVVEIKCGESVYRKTSGYGRVPHYYFGQLQHILAVTGLESIDFWCYLPGLPGVLVSRPARRSLYRKTIADRIRDSGRRYGEAVTPL